jgi:NADH-quinone oxidoreductase subunit I
MGLLGKGLLDGMVVTAKNFVGSYFDKERLTTVQYPEERVPLPENSRSFPFLVYDENKDPIGTMRCVACKICEMECPPQCIYIVMDRDDKGKPMQRPKVFDIDISVCMQCQICVEVCPFDAIKMDTDYEKAQFGRFDDLVEHLDDLLKSNAYYHSIHPTEAAAVDAKLDAEKKKKAAKKGPAPAATPAPAAKPAAPVPAKAAAPAAPAAAKGAVTIPADAPFTAEQREWLAKFLGGTAAPATPAAAAAAPAPASAPAAEAPTESAPAEAAPAAAPADTGEPWHDPGLSLPERMKLAEGKSLAEKLYAAMAQTDCHACGYDCKGYAEALASGAEGDISLCVPGASETEAELAKLLGK